MKINPKETIAESPLLKIRDLLKKGKAESIVLTASFLKITKKKARQLLKNLLELGYIEEVQVDGYKIYRNTLKGNALALSKAVPSLSREKADALYNAFIERVKQVNQEDYYLYKVTKVQLFGSYLTVSPVVNDIDICLELDRKEADSEIWLKQNQARVSEAAQKGVRFNTYLDELFYSEREVRSFLSAKSRYLSFHDPDDGILAQTATKQVFP